MLEYEPMTTLLPHLPVPASGLMEDLPPRNCRNFERIVYEDGIAAIM